MKGNSQCLGRDMSFVGNKYQMRLLRASLGGSVSCKGVHGWMRGEGVDIELVCEKHSARVLFCFFDRQKKTRLVRSVLFKFYALKFLAVGTLSRE